MSDEPSPATPSSVSGDDPWAPDPTSKNRVPIIAGGVGLVIAIVVIILVAAGVFSSTTTAFLNNPTAASACDADARTVESAVASYDAYPPAPCAASTCTIGPERVGTQSGDIDPGRPGTYGTATNAARLVSNGDLEVWPSSLFYAISLSSTSPGEAMVYVPATNPVGVQFDYETGTSGCNAL